MRSSSAKTVSSFHCGNMLRRRVAAFIMLIVLMFAGLANTVSALCCAEAETEAKAACCCPPADEITATTPAVPASGHDCSIDCCAWEPATTPSTALNLASHEQLPVRAAQAAPSFDYPSILAACAHSPAIDTAFPTSVRLHLRLNVLIC